MQTLRVALLAGLSPLAISVAGSALAQSASNQETTLQPVIVTAQKRAEDLQKTPVTVSVISGSTMDKMQINDVSTLVAAVPGLQYSFSFSNPQFTIRGITNYSDGPWVEAAVNTYIDGVYEADNQTGDFLLNDVSQVQVLKGPQGTLFGRNALAGVILITTKTPSQTPSAEFDVGYGNFDTVTGKFYGTTGITPTLAADVSVYVQKQNDGWGENLYDGGQLHFGEEEAYRSKWVFTPDDATTVTFTGSYDHSVPPILGPATLNGVYPSVTTGPQHLGGYWDSYLPNIGDLDFTQYGGSVRADHDFGWSQLVSITGLTYGEIAKNATKPAAYPYDPSDPAEGQSLSGLTLNALQLVHTKTYSEELQLKSPDSSSITWIVGAFFLNNRINNIAYRQAITAASPTVTQDYEVVKSAAGFGQVTLPVFSPHTRLSLGLRYTSDTADVNGNNFTSADVVIPASSAVSNPEPSATWNEPTWAAILSHDFGRRTMGYASYSRGYESGQYEISSSVNAAPVKPETLDAYEVGLKTSTPSDRLRANTSLFYYKLRNLVVHQNIDDVSVETNAAAAKMEGVDFELDYLPISALMFTGGVSYVDPRYTDYKNATFYEPNPNGNGTYVTTLGDATGDIIQYAEKLSASLGANYELYTDVGGFSLSAIENYHSGAHYDPQGLLVQSPYSVVNVSLEWTPPGGSWTIKLWTNNLANAKYATLFANTPVMFMNPSPPRTFGVQFSYRWEK